MDMPNNKRIKYCRLFRGMTQDQLSELTGFSQSRISKIETGRTELKKYEYTAIMKELNFKLPF